MDCTASKKSGIALHPITFSLHEGLSLTPALPPSPHPALSPNRGGEGKGEGGKIYFFNSSTFFTY